MDDADLLDIEVEENEEVFPQNLSHPNIQGIAAAGHLIPCSEFCFNQEDNPWTASTSQKRLNPTRVRITLLLYQSSQTRSARSAILISIRTFASSIAISFRDFYRHDSLL